ncbi:aminotransferase class I/II-fold pyridoxal phosphate-dependent enzyme [Nonomuraea pusilla]|uniref:DNA-binding transcriptional regulator, MocR family, contains an aminotransferase domain n=1 Tax=Nonomuraea pusilla TaxID=46177 RepID=A0A1H7WRK5_9ACTN|nr:aminotransferase class I/II-fold pyridoxal phosphate-dependent enzyme [Nonomuraea pusilla]SEM24024.1 DNA-binding transcriptional regulator, MocR family, contains an aminotransferase domain [Nonomuraea pusilla]
MSGQISGHTASDIAASVRRLVDSGALVAGDMLPSVRELAGQLGVNRNTVVAAYRQLVQAGVAVTRGRGGTSIAQPAVIAQEGFASNTVLRDLGSGNPDPRALPDVASALASISATPVLYGQAVADPELAQWATRWLAADQPREFGLQVTSGAVDAVERLLAQALTQGDAVALEDPCFLTSVHTARLAGYRTVPVPVDDEGMTADGLRAALAAGVRAVVCTPRAHNPTGTALTAARAAQLREALAEHPYVLVIEDDHFSLLSSSAYHTVIGPAHRRWALVRSVSKFLGPDLRLALVAADPETSTRLSARLTPGTMWVSHLLQRLAHGLLTDPEARERIARAREHYRSRNASFVAVLAQRGIAAQAADGLNVWVDVNADARSVAEQLMRRGWLARTGDEFALNRDGPSARHLRLTVHDLDETATQNLADDLAAAIAALPRLTGAHA